jgi:uncharacterized protein YaiL (DUF2058 family)
MNPLAALAVKSVGAAGVAALLSVGAVSASTARPTTNAHPDRHAVRAAVIESEADVLGIAPQTLVEDLKAGQKASDLARDKGITQEQFEARLGATLKPLLETLVDKKVITQAQADRLLDRISKGHIPFWNGLHSRKK